MFYDFAGMATYLLAFIGKLYYFHINLQMSITRMDELNSKWHHPGGKLVEQGPMSLTDEELLAVLIGSGYKGRSAQAIARELMDCYYSLAGLLGKTSSDISQIKGLKNGKTARISAAFEMTRRIFSENNWDLPNSRLLKLGLPSATDAGLLAVLIGSGYKARTSIALSNELLKKYKSISGLMGKKLSDMAKIDGLGDVKIIRIAAALEVARRIARALEKE